MRVLAIESSGPVASVALWEDGEILAEETGPFNITHSETLMPMVAEIIEDQGKVQICPDYIAVSGGPGSFTGLRIGSATAKGLAMAWDVDIVHVPTLNAMAYNFFGLDRIIVPMMDARRGQVYAGIYHFSGRFFEILKEGCAISAADLIKEINEKYADQRVLFFGDGATTSLEAVINDIKFEYEVSPEIQRASSVAVLGARLAMCGKSVSADMEAPEYFRPSQAERVKAEKEANG